MQARHEPRIISRAPRIALHSSWCTHRRCIWEALGRRQPSRHASPAHSSSTAYDAHITVHASFMAMHTSRRTHRQMHGERLGIGSQAATRALSIPAARCAMHASPLTHRSWRCTHHGARIGKCKGALGHRQPSRHASPVCPSGMMLRSTHHEARITRHASRRCRTDLRFFWL
jgi:hypothetical protein